MPTPGRLACGDVSDDRGDQERVGVVLAGGGARGAYEAGALSILLPALDARGERPRVVVGTSVGALNAGFLAATAQRPIAQVAAEGQAAWRDIRYGEVLAPLLSGGTLQRGLRYVAEFLGIRGVQLPALLDPAPLTATLRRLVSFEQMHSNVRAGRVDAVAVAASSAATNRTVVFHDGGGSPPTDDKRGIDYVATPLRGSHLLASAAIPGLFPAVEVAEPPSARGWYFDGGTRLNTPIKPALKLGSDRVVVVALNSIAGAPGVGSAQQPDVFEGAGQLLQALLVDPLVQDLRTLVGINERLAGGPGAARVLAGRRPVPYIFVAPGDAETVGRLAMDVFNEHYAGLGHPFRSPDLRLLGRAIAGGRSPTHGELLSYLLFAPEFAQALLELGRDDARRWLEDEHDDGPWQLGV